MIYIIFNFFQASAVFEVTNTNLLLVRNNNNEEFKASNIQDTRRKGLREKQ